MQAHFGIFIHSSFPDRHRKQARLEIEIPYERKGAGNPGFENRLLIGRPVNYYQQYGE
jgi:hypothetical protein